MIIIITNTPLTIYNQLEDGSFKRTVLPAIFWRNVKAQETKKYGAENASSVVVMIFHDQLNDYVPPESFNGTGWTADGEAETYICKGAVDIEAVNGISDVMSAVRDCYRVSSSTENLYGSPSSQHLKIEVK